MKSRTPIFDLLNPIQHKRRPILGIAIPLFQKLALSRRQRLYLSHASFELGKKAYDKLRCDLIGDFP
jgi:hypothetical protein